MAPETLIVGGAQKSCSSSLAASLGAHPRVAMESLECHAFEGLLWRLKVRRLTRKRRAASKAGLMFGFKRPEVFHLANLTERVHSEFPDSWFLVVLRDPLDRMVSALFHYYRHGLLGGPLDFAARLWKLLNSARSDLTFIERQIVEYSLYAARYGHVAGLYGQRTIVVFQEELLADPSTVLASIQRRLGLTVSADMRLARENIGSYQCEPRPLARVAGRLTYRENVVTGGTSPRSVVPWLLARPFSAADRLMERGRPPASKPMIPSEILARAVEVFGPDVRQLELLLGRCVPSNWKVGGPSLDGAT